MSYPIPAGELEITLDVKKSRFIARAAYAPSREKALAVVADMQRRYPDAGHHCYGFLVGHPQSASSGAANDDGEPSGTAGKPILNVIQHKGIGDVIVVVSRYFGGVKLGAGGLVRAYSQAAEQVLSALKISAHIAQSQILVALDFSQEQSLRHWLASHDGVVSGVTYGEQVRLQVILPSAQLECLQAWCEQFHATWELD
ncbi:YigZ family protein [Aliidiomarina halalkaliphila]|uniref:YigZ family protein n=1 Tax=Aliidiomarina halalkaliphila TaxID=2593535 RepID=A0A552X314_9GAMM|nr:YigZ family protein [Aliidiomarina halalkaliphila]TRW49356.1 YigZ family protein [Aliidiomarina halalkaliphila]